VLPSLLIFARTDGAPQLVGACGLGRRPSGAVELGYWISRAYWGRGIATEACAALIEIARTLGLPSLEGSHFLDNPASGRVLEKLGFEPIGIVAPRLSCGRGTEAPARLLRLSLVDVQAVEEPLAA
jgi:RimJ/RimL family protein N-acetyltransferase